MQTVTFLDRENLRKNLIDALNYLIENPDIVSVPINQDHKYSLSRTPYRFEIRTRYSNTWITYVMYRDIPFDIFAEALAKKYIDLVLDSNPEYFEG